MPDISVLIPTYNRLWSLPRAVDSCRAAACEVEIVVVDDRSNDGTWAWLQEQPDITALRGQGLGKPWAVNKAYNHAQSRYVRFLDSDDWLPDGVIDAQLAVAESTSADLVVAGYDVYRDVGGQEEDRVEQVDRRPWRECDDFIAQQLGECDASHYSAFLFRRELLSDVPHRPDYELRDDRLLMLEVAMKDPDLAVYDGSGLCHRHHDRLRLQEVLGMRSVRRNLQQLKLYAYILERLHDRGGLTMRRRRAAASVLWPLAHWIAYSHPGEAAEVADWVFALDPDFTPPEPGLLGRLYRTVGFRWTERVLRLRRLLLAPFRSLPSPEAHTFDVPPPEAAPETPPVQPAACTGSQPTNTE
jgi:glycosyltransferase involved in cell wall biosynthesis